MSDTPITKRPVVYRIPGQEAVTVLRDVPYRDDLTLDVYHPPESKSEERLPAVVFVTGYPDPGFQKFLGCRQKEMASYLSWAKLVAASGLIAVTYANREPPDDAEAVLAFIRENAETLGIDEKRIGVWSCSGSVPTALSVLMNEPRRFIKCAALCYGLMLDLDGHTAVTDGAAQFGYRNPAAGKSVSDLPRDLPLLIVRAGRDEFPHLNETLDRFVSKALECNLPVTLVNHAEAPHAFDINHDSETSREIIRQVLAFLRFHLIGESRETLA
jgi:acetyl esterase/lipase